MCTHKTTLFALFSTRSILHFNSANWTLVDFAYIFGVDIASIDEGLFITSKYIPGALDLMYKSNNTFQSFILETGYTGYSKTTLDIVDFGS